MFDCCADAMKVAGSNYYVWGNGCVFDTGDKIWLGNGNPNGNGEVIKINRGGGPS